LDSPKESWFLQDGSDGLLDSAGESRFPLAASNYWPLHFFHRFNPRSMLQEFENILSKSPSIANGALIFERPDGLFADYHYDPRFRLQTFQDCIERRKFVRQRINALLQVDFVILTLGLIEAWVDAESGLYLNRPPRLDLIEQFPARFRLQVLGEADVFESMKRILELLYSANPDMGVVLTVSPVPLAATFTGDDIAVANANSKATLLCAVNRLLQAFPRTCYFPSYEIVTHSNRSAAWAADGRHVRAEFVERIMDFFCSEMIVAS